MSKKFAIIGGGFSGTMLAVQLLEQAKHQVKVFLINNTKDFGKGVAYGTKEPYHLLNVPTCKMSAYPDKPTHFTDWLKQQDLTKWQINKASIDSCFVPRVLFGQYIHEIFQLTLENANSEKELIPIVDKTIGITLTNSKCTLQLEKQGTLSCDKVVLALGNPPPHDFLKRYHESSNQHYIHNPWQFDIKTIPNEDKILVIGTGLTAIDVLLSLKQKRHFGNITLLSRHGLLPQAHTQIQSPIDTLETNIAPRSAFHQLHTQARKAKDWRQVIDAQRPITQTLWSNWSNQEKRLFLRHIRAYWDIHRHRIAPEIHQTITQLLSEPQNNCIAARIQNIQTQKNGFSVQIIKRKNHFSETIDCDWLINCTGPNHDYKSLDNPLVQSLFSQGAIQCDRLKLGLHTETTGALIDQDGKTSDKLFTIGPPLKSALWEIIAVPDIRVKAKELAKVILEK